VPAVAGFDHLHLSGYVLLDDSSRAAGRAALGAARAAGLSTSVDPQAAPALTTPERAAAFLDDVQGVDLLLPNADELRALGGPEFVLERVRAVAVSAGAAGASWVDPAIRCSAAAPTVTVVDATGAGDAFDAGVLVAWLGGASPADALASGCAAGAAAVGRLGARP
jgi:sugar/nucleoside kinase (ribokinase family)